MNPKDIGAILGPVMGMFGQGMTNNQNQQAQQNALMQALGINQQGTQQALGQQGGFNNQAMQALMSYMSGNPNPATQWAQLQGPGQFGGGNVNMPGGPGLFGGGGMGGGRNPGLGFGPVPPGMGGMGGRPSVPRTGRIGGGMGGGGGMMGGGGGGLRGILQGPPGGGGFGGQAPGPIGGPMAPIQRVPQMPIGGFNRGSGSMQ